MNSCLSEMLHRPNSNSESAEMSVVERQRSCLKLQQQQLMQHQPFPCYNENEQLGGAFLGLNGDQGLCELVVSGAMKPDPGHENGLDDDFRNFLNYGNGSEFGNSYALPRTLSCPPNVAAEAATMSSAAARESSKKRKADKTQNLKAVAEEKSEEKKMKGCAEEDSKITEQNSNNKSTTTTATNKTTKSNTKENPKASEAPKTDYIHVRARRGQATDSHSLAERVRREKISERMKFLQDLVPGCNKITGKAGMLDEIINYVQSLQRQVEFLSMKLAAINPRLDLEVENYLVKEIFPSFTSSLPAIGASSSDMVDYGNLQYNALGQGISDATPEMVANHMDIVLRRTISAPVSIPQTFLDSNIQQITWEDELRNLYGMEHQQGRSSASFIAHPFTGFLEPYHVKLEM